MITSPTPRWLDAKHAMHDLAHQLGAAVIVGLPAGYVVISGESLAEVEALTDREILESMVVQ